MWKVQIQREGLTWGLYPLVVVRVDAHLILFEVEGILTGLNGTQLMVAVEVWPPPQATANDVRKLLALGDLQATIQRSDRTAKRERDGGAGSGMGMDGCPVKSPTPKLSLTLHNSQGYSPGLVRVVVQAWCIPLFYRIWWTQSPYFRAIAVQRKRNKHLVWLIWKYQCG